MKFTIENNRIYGKLAKVLISPDEKNTYETGENH
jgi:hypothetical protein